MARQRDVSTRLATICVNCTAVAALWPGDQVILLFAHYHPCGSTSTLFIRRKNGELAFYGYSRLEEGCWGYPFGWRWFPVSTWRSHIPGDQTWWSGDQSYWVWVLRGVWPVLLWRGDLVGWVFFRLGKFCCLLSLHSLVWIELVTQWDVICF